MSDRFDELLTALRAAATEVERTGRLTHVDMTDDYGYPITDAQAILILAEAIDMIRKERE